MIADLSLSKFLNDQDRYCYDVFELIYNIIDFWKQHKECITLFYDVDFERSNVIFDMSMLTNYNIIVHSTTFNWRFEININKLKISKWEKFVEDLQKQVIIYAFIIADVVTSKDESKSFDLLENYWYLKNIFNNDITEILSEQDYDDYAINLVKDKIFSYMFLYNLFQQTSWTSILFKYYFNSEMN